MRIGFGSAVGVILFAICVAFAFGYNRIGLPLPSGEGGG